MAAPLAAFGECKEQNGKHHRHGSFTSPSAAATEQKSSTAEAPEPPARGSRSATRSEPRGAARGTSHGAVRLRKGTEAASGPSRLAKRSLAARRAVQVLCGLSTALKLKEKAAQPAAHRCSCRSPLRAGRSARRTQPLPLLQVSSPAPRAPGPAAPSRHPEARDPLGPARRPSSKPRAEINRRSLPSPPARPTWDESPGTPRASRAAAVPGTPPRCPVPAEDGGGPLPRRPAHASAAQKVS
ncbi:translation initiation factor IF-2-like [Lagopus muta]|uniref:translation initiation factor IF-2-like n=1 Tax=Lagopus muta TaxID=64668 RepID=UPI00209E58B7|nr:translation initiation factor IF-2-like [Lagopus muta]